MSQMALNVKFILPRRRGRPLPGDDAECMYEATYYLGRRKRDGEDDNSGEYAYEIWVVAELRSAEAVTVPRQVTVDRELSPESAGDLRKNLRNAIDDVAADRVEGAVWKFDDLSEDQVTRLLDLPEALHALVVKPLDGLAGEAGLPAPMASVSSDVVGTMLLKPIQEPLENVLHGLEIVGTIIALLIGAHGLLVTCVKHLIHDELKEMLSDAFGQVISAAKEALGSQPSVTAASEAPRPAAVPRQTQSLSDQETGLVGGGQSRVSAAHDPDNAGILELQGTVLDDQQDEAVEQLDDLRDVSGPTTDLHALDDPC